MTSPLPCDPRQGTHYFRRTEGWPEPEERCECGGVTYSGAKADQGVTLVVSWDREDATPPEGLTTLIHRARETRRET